MQQTPSVSTAIFIKKKLIILVFPTKRPEKYKKMMGKKITVLTFV